MKNNNLARSIALIVALGGLLMGFDASVISGVVKFIEPEFGLNKLELGWAVASLTLTSTLAMMVAGPISDRFGRRQVLKWAALLYAISAISSAFAPNFFLLVTARMIGGLGVGASLILAPMYIAEIAPKEMRGRLVSFNQLNIVIGISLAFFSNYVVLRLAQSSVDWAISLGFAEHQWRWMLGLETLPAVLYFIGLFLIPKSPRWLILKGRYDEAEVIMSKITGKEQAAIEIKRIRESIAREKNKAKAKLGDLFKPALRLVLTIGIVVAVLQQITGINSVFFYAPMIFEQSGLGTDASFMQAIFVGLVNLVFTILAILFIDRIGRKPLLSFGVAGIALSMFLLSYGFSAADYSLSEEALTEMSAELNRDALNPLIDEMYTNEASFEEAFSGALGQEEYQQHRNELIKGSISMNTALIMFAILAFVASFAISIGPVMWVLFSELFPNRIRGIAISFVGLINSAISFLVQWIFPWELDVLGSSLTFLIYGVFAALGLIFIVKVIPETKGKSLEELEAQLVK